MIRKFVLTSCIFVLVFANTAIALADEPLTALSVFDAVNVVRRRNGRAELVRNVELETAAQTRALYIIRTQRFAHTGPANEPFFSWIKIAHIEFVEAGENLAKDFSDPQTLVRAWLTSPTHRTNMLDARYTESGIGLARGIMNGQATTVVVQFFIQPEPNARAGTEPSLSLPAITSGTVLGASSAFDRTVLAWLIISLLINVSIAFWLLDHWRWHRRVDRVFTK